MRLKCLPILSIVLMSVAASTHAGSAWVWLDERGQRVFSDMPPPPSVSDHRILRKPASAAARPATPEPTTSTQPKPATRPAADTSVQREALIKQIESEAVETEKRNAAIREENCKRAKAALSVLAGSGRVVTLNDKGQRVTMDPATKKAERARAEEAIAENCL